MDYSDLPKHMQGAARRYVEDGIEPGGFLTALLANDFMGAFGRADTENVAALKNWARWIYNEAPNGCHGSYECVTDWCKAGGLNGLARASTPSAA